MVIEELLQDWFGERCAETFVHRSKTHRSGWDESLGSYSSYLTKKNKPLDVLKAAYSLCKNRVSSMLPGRMVPLSFNGQDSYTNGQQVVISTEVVDEKSFSVDEKLDILLGLTTHELAHILHTVFDKKYFRDDFQKTILNILEDERIEYLVGEEFPGYGAFLEKVKQYYFDFKYTKKNFDSPGKEAFDCFFKLVRYPKYVSEEAVTTHQDILSRVKQIITPYPLTFEATYTASCQIADLFTSYFNEKFEAQKQDPSEGDGGTASNADTEIKSLVNQLKDLLPTSGENGSNVEECSVLKKDPLAMSIINGTAERAEGSHDIFIRALPQVENYNTVRATVLAQARSLARVIALDTCPQMAAESCMRSGAMDESKLVEAVLGRETVYRQAEEKQRESIEVVLMIDESGSMDGEKIEHAKAVAVLFHEALRLVPLARLSIYGFTSDHDGDYTNTLTIYKEPGLDLAQSIASISSKSSNRDGQCIRAVVDRHSSKSKGGKKLLFVISDGHPSAMGYGTISAIVDTRQAVDHARSKKYYPVQIGIEVDETTQAKMFTDYINYESSAQMVDQIGKLLRFKIKRSYGR